MPQKDHEEPVIGADHDAAYSTRAEPGAFRARHDSRRPSLWPLYLLLLLLVAAIVAMGMQYYQDRQHWSARFTALTDKAEEVATSRREMSTNLDQILDGIRNEQQNQRIQLETLQQRLDQQVDNGDQDKRLNSLEKADALRQQTLVSLQQSLDSLDTVIEGLQGTYNARFSDMDNTDAEQSRQLQAIEDNRQQLKALADSVSDQKRTINLTSSRIDELTTQTERLQQNQTSLHAAMESLQDILNP